LVNAICYVMYDSSREISIGSGINRRVVYEGLPGLVLNIFGMAEEGPALRYCPRITNLRKLALG
jgi:hypothetical protein